MNVRSALRLRSAVLSVDDLERMIGSRSDFHWGKGSHSFSADGLCLGSFRTESYVEFDLFEGKELPLIDTLKSCSTGLKHLRDLFTGVRDSGGSSELYICRPSGNIEAGVVTDREKGDLQNLGLDVLFGISAALERNGDDRAPALNIEAARLFIKALIESDEGPGMSLAVCVKYRGDRSVYEGWAPSRLGLVGEDSLGDPGFGPGPVMYSDIEWLCVPAVPRPPRPLDNHRAKYGVLLAISAKIPGVRITEDGITFLQGLINIPSPQP